MNTIKLKGIPLNIDGEDFLISIDEARELYNELGKVFGERYPINQPTRDPFDPMNQPYKVTW